MQRTKVGRKLCDGSKGTVITIVTGFDDRTMVNFLADVLT